jgi:hypothetical protein
VFLLFQCFLQVKLAESNTTPEPAPPSLAIVGLTPGKSRYRTSAQKQLILSKQIAQFRTRRINHLQSQRKGAFGQRGACGPDAGLKAFSNTFG